MLNRLLRDISWYTTDWIPGKARELAGIAATRLFLSTLSGGRMRLPVRRAIRKALLSGSVDVFSGNAEFTSLAGQINGAGLRELAGTLAGVPDGREPVCSVVIPVYGKAAHTFGCLAALYSNPQSTPFEVIVVDNGSNDWTCDVLRIYEGHLRVIRNFENKGFAVACNQGAGAALGEFVVFLNNDTRVTGAWLDSLAETAKRIGDAGAIGGMLIYPDGSVQEAGGMVWRDGSASNYGNGGDPDDPKYGYMREVDYCSAACLLVRSGLFNDVGGFDTAYSPAYYEDTDLCFKIRSAGKKVVYQPGCRIIHYEGATSGNDDTSGLKSYQRTNRGKFASKWNEALDELPKRSRSGADKNANRMGGPEVLFIDLQVPRRDRDSGSLRTYQMMRLLLESGCRVAVMLRRNDVYDGYCKELGVAGVRVVPEGEVWKELAAGRFAMTVIARELTASLYLGKVKRLAPGIPVVFDTVDLRYVREKRHAELAGGLLAGLAARLVKRREVSIAKRCDLTVTVSEEERNLLLSEAPSINSVVISNIHSPTGVRPDTGKRDSVMFIGSYRHLPNVDSAVYLANEIMPRVRRMLESDVRLVVVGTDPPEDVRRLSAADVEVTGYVPDVSKCYETARVLAAPLRFGAGVKGKIGEALSYGVPVVTTKVGAEGMGLEHNVNAMVTDDPDEFAEQIARLFREDALWYRLALNGQEHILNRFGPSAAREGVAVLSGLAKSAYGRMHR
jgi:GT2 family glycosyltransferase/glycosyltransferase involved in cell wall biosynthesis